MRKQALLGLLGLLGMCCSAMAAAVAVDGRPVEAEKVVVSRSAADEVGPGDELARDEDLPGVADGYTPVLLDPHMTFKRVVKGADGQVREIGEAEVDEGGVAGPGEKLIYQNILGIHGINFPTNQPVSDDISTIAPDGCNLTRYKFKVLGKVLPAGTGGAYTVTYGLYTNCPLAVGSTNAQRDLVRIPGTEGVLAFPDDAPRDIEHIVDSLTPVALPTNVYLSLRFNRGNCGTVVGAPAMIGFSGDLWDFPGFPCNGFLGGFPQLPHTSYWLEMYGTTNCSPAFAGYKCQKPSGGFAPIGAGVQGVDDIKLIVNNCQMIGYEVAVRGVGFYTFDLRSQCSGSVVPGSEKTFQINASTTPLLQIARFTFNPPITLTSDSYYLGFKCSSNSAGAVIAGIQPIIGQNESDYFVVGQEGGCNPVLPTQGVHGAVNLAITCAGSQPVGACCDPHLTECNAGADQGKRCSTSAECASPGTCEAVCRQTTELNCPFPPPGQELRPTWKQGAACTPDPFLPNACGVAACCHIRINPNTQQEEEVCGNLTKNQCAAVPPLEKARLWQIGEYCGVNAQTCPRNACLARDGSCYSPHPTPGCSDPFCCSDICALGSIGAFCCNTAWDQACVDLAQIECSRAPSNDQCAPDFPTRGMEGAVLIPFPGSRPTNNTFATESFQDSGFCCHNGTGVCVGGLAPGLPCIANSDCPGTAGSPATCSERTPDPGATGLGTVWFKWVQGAGTTAQVSTCTSNSPALDSILQVFEPNDDSTALTQCGTLSVIGCNDDNLNCGSLSRNSRLCLSNLTPGKTYYVLVAAKLENRRGQYIVQLAENCNPPSAAVANDYCRNATPITDATPDDPLVIPFAMGLSCNGGPIHGAACTVAADCRVCVGGANAGQPCTATANCSSGGGTCPAGGQCNKGPATFDCPAASCSPDAGNDLWWNYTATCTGEATFSTCGSGNPNTNIAVYEGCTSCPHYLDNASWLACNADNNQSGCVVPARVVVPVTEGQCYKVRVADNGFAVGGNLTITCPPITCPEGYVDCQPNGICDNLDIANCPPGNNACKDCNNNLRPDFCDIRDGIEQDCQGDGIPDSCQLANNDCQPDGIPDDCGGTVGGNCPINGACSGLVSSVPSNCSLDARRPHAPGAPGTLQGWNSLTMTFSADCEAVPGDFTVTCSPTAAPCPTVLGVVAAGATQTITLSSVIPAGNWTCVTHTPSGEEVCLGSLPGDCSGNGTTNPSDIITLIDHLNGVAVPPLLVNQCDIDRSAVCAPADIISLIDLLNGSNGFIVWNGRSLPVCPNP